MVIAREGSDLCMKPQVQRSLRYLKKQIPEAMLQQLAQIGNQAVEPLLSKSRRKEACRQPPQLRAEVGAKFKLSELLGSSYAKGYSSDRFGAPEIRTENVKSSKDGAYKIFIC